MQSHVAHFLSGAADHIILNGQPLFLDHVLSAVIMSEYVAVLEAHLFNFK
jgi:hypothetical protein